MKRDFLFKEVAILFFIVTFTPSNYTLWIK